VFSGRVPDRKLRAGDDPKTAPGRAERSATFVGRCADCGQPYSQNVTGEQFLHRAMTRRCPVHDSGSPVTRVHPAALAEPTFSPEVMEAARRRTAGRLIDEPVTGIWVPL